MNREKLTLIFLFVVFSFSTIVVISNLIITESGNSIIAYKKNKLVGTEVWSQKKQWVKGFAKADSPDKFAEMHMKIRTAPGKTKPTYKRNYRFTELAKAKTSARLLKGFNNSVMGKLNWVERGPANVGGRTRAIVVDPDDATHQTWFAGAVGGGVWKTVDAGASWIPLTDTLPNLAVSCIEIAKSNSNILYVGTGEGFYNADAVDGNGIFKTTDKGRTWEQLATTAWDNNFKHVNRLAINPNDENIVIAATNKGIFKTINGGDYWSKVFSGRVLDLRANPENFNTLFASTSLGIIRTHNAGDTWQLPEKAKFGNGRIEIAPALTDTNRVYASARFRGDKDLGESDTSKMFITIDGGTSWLEVTDTDSSKNNWLGGQGWYDNTIGVNPFNENIVYMGGIDLWKAEILFNSDSTVINRNTVAITDGYGQYPTSTNIHVDHHNITMFPTNDASKEFIFLNGNDGGIAVSYDAGNSFTEVGDNGYNTSQFYGVDKSPSGSQYLGGMQDNGTWESAKNVDADKTTKYIARIGGDGFEVSWHYGDAKKMIGGSQYNMFWKTENGWLSRSPASNGFNGWGKSNVSPFISKIAKSYSDPNLLYTITTEGVYQSKDFGDNWTLHQIAEFDSAGYFTFAQITISIAEPQVVWAGVLSDGLFVSIDGGLSFNKVTDCMGGSRIAGLDTHPTDEATAYLSFAISETSKIMRTTDYGQTWSDITGYGSGSVSTNGFPNVATYCVSVMPYNTDIIWVGTDIGLIESTDGGATWHLASNGLPQVAIWEIRIVDDEVVVATHGRGIWSVSLPELADHKPPVATLPPLLTSVNQGVTGLVLNASLRSVYDSTHVMVNETNVLTIKTNKVVDTLVTVPIHGTGTQSVALYSYKGIRVYKSSLYDVEVIELLETKLGYTNNFATNSDDFTFNGLEITTPSGFSNPSLNSPHPYLDKTEFIALLRVPVVVASSDATFKYDDIAIVEKGDPGSIYGDYKFWDYVIVEASNGGEWIPLEDGYDARAYNDWLTAYDGSQNGTPTMYKSHSINLLDKFSAGDTLLFRFRLLADDNTNGWGWSIDNIIIQEQFVAVNDEMNLPTKFELSQNYPNPFNPTTKINFSLPSDSKVKLKVFNTLGEEVTTLVNETRNAGVHLIEWNANNLASGIYLYRIDAESIGDAKKFSSVKKMLLLK
jgi:photosystem II stability/assembly factor-like uncharacterized protein